MHYRVTAPDNIICSLILLNDTKYTVMIVKCNYPVSQSEQSEQSDVVAGALDDELGDGPAVDDPDGQGLV